MIHPLRLPYCCVDVNYCVRVDCDAWRLIIPLSMGADVYAYAYAYAYALLLAATFAVYGCLLYCVV